MTSLETSQLLSELQLKVVTAGVEGYSGVVFLCHRVTNDVIVQWAGSNIDWQRRADTEKIIYSLLKDDGREDSVSPAADPMNGESTAQGGPTSAVRRHQSWLPQIRSLVTAETKADIDANSAFTGNSVLQCKRCCQAFTAPTTFHLHVRQHYTKYLCACGQLFPSYGAALKHKRSMEKSATPDNGHGEIFEVDKVGFLKWCAETKTFLSKFGKCVPITKGTAAGVPSCTRGGEQLMCTTSGVSGVNHVEVNRDADEGLNTIGEETKLCTQTVKKELMDSSETEEEVKATSPLSAHIDDGRPSNSCQFHSDMSNSLPLIASPPTSQPLISSPPISQSLTSSPPTSQPLISSPPTPQSLTSSPPTSQSLTSSPPTSQSLICSPPTSQPLISSPPTPQSLTSSPPTSQPLISSPPTPQPLIASPPTSQPLICSPPTSQPLISSPPTPQSLIASPPTSHPLISSPPTSQPLISSPPTSQPLISSPPTSQPLISSPPTSQSLTSSPPTSQPLISSPHTSQPLISSPPTSQSLTSSPPTSHPLTSSPPTPWPLISLPPAGDGPLATLTEPLLPLPSFPIPSTQADNSYLLNTPSSSHATHHQRPPLLPLPSYPFMHHIAPSGTVSQLPSLLPTPQTQPPAMLTAPYIPELRSTSVSCPTQPLLATPTVYLAKHSYHPP